MISTDTPVNVIQGAPPLHERDRSGDRGARELALVWLSVYLGASALPLAIAGSSTFATLHLLLIALACWSIVSRSRAARVIGDLMPLVVAPLLYGEIPRIIAAIGSRYHDALVSAWEAALFGGQPSRILAGALPYGPLSELLHAGYLAYYPLIFVPPLVAYVAGRRRALHQTVLALTITYTVCWTVYAFFPVEGPRFLWAAPRGVPDGFFRAVAVRILAAGSSRGAAFPSSHMAVSVVQATMAWRWQPTLAPVLTAIACLVGAGAVYGGFHYGVDILAGAALGLAVGAAVWKLAK